MDDIGTAGRGIVREWAPFVAATDDDSATAADDDDDGAAMGNDGVDDEGRVGARAVTTRGVAADVVTR